MDTITYMFLLYVSTNCAGRFKSLLATLDGTWPISVRKKAVHFIRKVISSRLHSDQAKCRTLTRLLAVRFSLEVCVCIEKLGREGLGTFSFILLFLLALAESNTRQILRDKGDCKQSEPLQKQFLS